MQIYRYALYLIMNKDCNELFSIMSSRSSFVTQASASSSLICSDGFNSNSMLDTVSDNNNVLKAILKGGVLESTRSEHESNFPASQISHGVQVTKTVKHKICKLVSRNCALDNRTSLDEGGTELASACFGASVVKANKNEPVKAERRLEKNIAQGRAVLSTSRGENQLDENGNPLPIEETGSEVDDATCDVVESRKPSRMLEDQLPENAVHSGMAEGKAPKGAKEVARRGTRAQGKVQMKQKSSKSKKNEISAKVRNLSEQRYASELSHHGYCAEVKNQKQDCRSQMNSLEADYHGEIDDEQQVMSLSETGSVEDDCKDEFNEAESTMISTDTTLTCISGQQDSHATNGTFPGESYQAIPEEKLSPSRSQARKKRRKGKQSRSQNSKPDSASVGVKMSSVTSINTTDLVLNSSSDVLPVSISPTNSLKSMSFCVHQLSNAREKPSARVPPSRLTSMDHGLNSRVMSCGLGEKNSFDLDEKILGDIPIVENKRIDGDGLHDVEDQDVRKVVSHSLNNTFIVETKSSPDLETSESFKNDLAQGRSTEVAEEMLTERMPCVTVSVHPLSPSRKQSTLIGQQGRVKPQSTVNPFSMLDTTTLVKPLHTVDQTLHSNPLPRIRFEPTAGAKPKFNQPPRLKPRSLVNPLRVDQSQHTRIRPHPKFDPVSTPTDLPKPTPHDMSEIRTSSVVEPNPTFRILRRRPFAPTSPVKHSDSSSFAETKNFVAATEQYSNSCRGNGCHSDSSPSVAKTTVRSESCHGDSAATTTKRSDAAKKPPNCRVSDRKILDHSPITESIRSSTPGSSMDAESGPGERESGFRGGLSSCDRLPSGPRASLKSTKTIVEHRTNLCYSQVAENSLTFDLVRAQQYLRTEFLKTMELKRRGGKVKILKL